MRTTRTSSLRLLPCMLAAGLLMGAGVASVHAHPGSAATTRTTPAEMQRGVPGIDVDLGTSEPASRNGVPGVDVDLRAQRRGTADGVPGVDVDANTRVAGAGTAGTGTSLPPRQDRN